MKKLINKIVGMWQAIIKFRENMSRTGKSIWDSFWYFLITFALALIIFAFFQNKIEYHTSAWIAAVIGAGVGIFVAIYVYFVEEKPETNKKPKKEKVKTLTLKDVNNKPVTGKTEVINSEMDEEITKNAFASDPDKSDDKSKTRIIKDFVPEDDKPKNPSEEENFDSIKSDKAKEDEQDLNLDETLEV